MTLHRLGTRIIEVHDAWAFAAAESALALETWRSALDAEKGLAYGAYVASLDREEQAATVLAERLGGTGGPRLRATG
jgi:hypothetical protein